MKKFVLVLVALCAITCLFMSCDTAAADDDNPLIGTWISGPIGEEEKICYFKLIIRKDTMTDGESEDDGKTWEGLDEKDFTPYTHTDTTITISDTDFDEEPNITLTYTLSGDTLIITRYGVSIIFTRE